MEQEIARLNGKKRSSMTLSPTELEIDGKIIIHRKGYRMTQGIALTEVKSLSLFTRPRYWMIGLGAMLVALSFVFLVTVLVLGIIMILAGIALIVLGIVLKKKGVMVEYCESLHAIEMATNVVSMEDFQSFKDSVFYAKRVLTAKLNGVQITKD